MIDKNVFKKHMLLVSDYVTYIGSKVGYNLASYQDFYHEEKLART